MPANPFLLAFPAAVEYFRKKLPIPTEGWRQVSDEYSAIAFTISSITRLSLLADIKDIIEKQLDSGISPESFREQFKASVIKAGWNPNFSPYRIGLILSQNVRTAYSFGRFEQMEDPALKRKRPYKQWVHRDSRVPRPHHLAQHLKVYPADAECFKAIFPPPFSCRCTAYLLSDRDLAREGLTLSTPPKLSAIAEPSFSTGFPDSLEKQRSQLIADALERLPPNLSKLLEEDADFNEPLDYYDPRQARDARGRFGSGGSATSSKEEPKANPVKKKTKIQQKMDEQAELGKAAFDNAPDNIKKAVEKHGHPPILSPTAGKGAYFLENSGVHMDSKPKEFYASVYRHEYGHWIDYKLGGNNSYLSSSDAGIKAFDLDVKAFDKDLYGGVISSLLKDVPKNNKSDTGYSWAADIAGAITKNKVGHGHSDSYLNWDENRRTEVFANIVSLAGSGNPKLIRAAERLAPNMYKLAMEKINE